MRMIKCKGCTGEVSYTPLAQVDKKDYASAGPALKHFPSLSCEWFTTTPASQVIAYIKVAEYKAQNERDSLHNTALSA